jgi:hypothetical protein
MSEPWNPEQEASFRKGHAEMYHHNAEPCGYCYALAALDQARAEREEDIVVHKYEWAGAPVGFVLTPCGLQLPLPLPSPDTSWFWDEVTCPTCKAYDVRPRRKRSPISMPASDCQSCAAWATRADKWKRTAEEADDRTAAENAAYQEQAALVARLKDCIHQPNPTDPSRWDIAPGKHREFSALCTEVKGHG